MTGMHTMVDELLADPLGPARERARAGGRVVGYVGVDIPVELITAAGAHALRLPALADIETANADRYLESSFSPAVRRVAEQWLSGAYDFLDAVVLSRSDDSAQRLYYYLCELQRRGLAAGPRALLYDIAKIPRESSRRHTLAATTRLAGELGTRAQSLPEAIASRNRRRELLRDLVQWRASDAPPRGTAVERLLRAADLGDPDAFDRELSGWMRAPRAHHAGPRLLLAGSAPPDERLHARIERAEGCVVDESGDHSARRLGDPISPGAAESADSTMSSIERLSNHYHALRHGSRALVDRAAAIDEQLRQSRVDGVVIWLIEEDESLAWEVPSVHAMLAASGTPHLLLTRRRWEADDGALEAVSEFVANLGSQS